MINSSLRSQEDNFIGSIGGIVSAVRADAGKRQLPDQPGPDHLNTTRTIAEHFTIKGRLTFYSADQSAALLSVKC